MPTNRRLRTDRGDDESDGPDDEWDEGRIPGCQDGRGDDDIDVAIWRDGTFDPFSRQSKTPTTTA